jgi:hypothetical protein
MSGDAFSKGLGERIANDAVTAADCRALAEVCGRCYRARSASRARATFLKRRQCAVSEQALRPLVGRASSWTSHVAGEWCQAVSAAERDASAGVVPKGRGSNWYEFRKAGTNGARAWTLVPSDPGVEAPDATAHNAMPLRSAPRHWPVPGGSPLAVRSAAWTYAAVAQSSPFPESENVISVTFISNVPLGPAEVRGPLHP